jgi:hypothetical protein
MVIHCFNEHHQYLLFIDLEFDDRELIQFAGLLFKRVDDEVYQLARTFNQYRTPDDKVGYPFAEYTGITQNFLQENGIPLSDLQQNVMDVLLKDIPLNQLEIISHGLKNDRMVLQENGINLSTFTDENGKMKPIDGYCTYNNGRRILGRKTQLKEGDLAEEAGFYLHNAHNAANDVWAEVAVYTYLRKIEEQTQEGL